jgi:hypothetical protein
MSKATDATTDAKTSDDRRVRDTERRTRAHLREVAGTSQFTGTVENVSRNATNGFVIVDVSAGDGEMVCYAPVPREPSNHGLRFRGVQDVGVNGGDIRLWFDDEDA